MKRRKQDSIRRWKARYYQGKWIPWKIWNETLNRRLPYSEKTCVFDIHRQTFRLLNPSTGRRHKPLQGKALIAAKIMADITGRNHA